MASGFAAGAGADMLQEVLRRKFTEALAQQKLQEDIRQANMQHQVQQTQLGQGQQRIDQEASQFDAQGPLRNAQTAHLGAETTSLANAPAEAEKDRASRASQIAQQEMFTQGQNEANHKYTSGENTANRQNAVKIANISAESRQNSPSGLVMVQTVDESGNPVTKIVPKQAGAEFKKPANATTATRVSSAETVNQVGNDLIAKLSDPRFKAAVGPAMGRVSTLQDFIGNPPPEFSELAGQIESYALANMGVHGMRSAQGAQQIAHLLKQHHTPESLIATIRGLNDFSTRFVQNNKPKSGGPSPASGAPPAEPLAQTPKIVKYDMNGNPIK